MQCNKKERSLETIGPAPPVSQPPARVGPKPWGLPAILLALALPTLLWASSLILASITGTEDDLTSGEIVASLIVTIVLLDGGFIALAAGFSVWKYHLSWRELGLHGFNVDQWWLPLAAAGGAYVGIIAYSVLLTVVGADAAVPEQEELDQLFESRAVLPLTGLATVIMAPLAEEIFFRGFIFAGLIRPFGLLGALVASGFLFGAFHVTSIDTVGLVLPFAAIGMLFAWLYYRTGSLLPSMTAHLLFNLVSFIALAAVTSS